MELRDPRSDQAPGDPRALRSSVPAAGHAPFRYAANFHLTRPVASSQMQAGRYAPRMRLLASLNALYGLPRRSRGPTPSAEQKRIASVLTPVRRRR
jgi:hypothetical protein